MKKIQPVFSGPVVPAALTALLVLAAGIVLATPAASKAPAAATVLEYKMPAGRTLTYLTSAEEGQAMDVMGQSVNTDTASKSTLTFNSNGLKGKDFLLGVAIDDMTMNVSSSTEGDLSVDLSSVKGKSFDMALSPLGSEVDVSGAEGITYSIAGETRNLAAGFKTFFPDLPGKAVNVGDSWPSADEVEEKTGSMTIQIALQYVNTLEGFEKVDGMECARISSEFTGTVSGFGSQMGQDLTFAGSTKGKMGWYFAVKEGIYVKGASESTAEMSIDVTSAGMTIPLTTTSKSEVKLTGRI